MEDVPSSPLLDGGGGRRDHTQQLGDVHALLTIPTWTISLIYESFVLISYLFSVIADHDNPNSYFSVRVA